MSSSRSLDIYNLVKSLTKSEKRAFKLYAKRGSGTNHQFLKLFDLMDSMEELDDDIIIKKLKLESSSKYSNLKRHLYSQLLSSLRMLNVDKKPNIKIREIIDYAYVLYDKGLYLQALKSLENAKALCTNFGTDLSLLTILEVEKLIHSRHITRQNEYDTNTLLDKTTDISNSISNRVHLSNLKMTLHRKYIEDGHIDNQSELNELSSYFNEQITQVNYEDLRIMEKVYYCQSFVWFHYVIHDYESCLQYAIRWVELYKSHELLQKRDNNLLLRGYHYVLTSAYNLNDLETHELYLSELEALRKDNYRKFNKNNKITSFLYVHSGRFNAIFISKEFKDGLKLVPRTLKRLKRYASHLDQHKVMVLHYKIAWLYIGAGNSAKALTYLNGIIALRKKSLREDIQSYARLLHLMALYDMDDYEAVLSHLRKYLNYFEKAQSTNPLQISALKYFQKLSNAPILEKKEIHKTFLESLYEMRKDRFAKKAFLYLDIIYWVERKL